MLLVVPQHLAHLYRPNTFQVLDWIQTKANPQRRSIALTKRGRAAMANRKRRREEGSGNTWIKWLLLFWFIGAGYVAFLWYIGFGGRDLGVRAIGVTLIIFGIRHDEDQFSGGR
jgi:hypothetical protein